MKPSKFNLVSELFGSSIIFNDDNQNVFVGERIKVKLAGSSIDIGDINSQKDWKRLLASLNYIRKKQQSQIFRFENIDEDFLLFPTHTVKNPSVILTIKKDIDQINNIERDLKERVKELECLYNVSHELQISGQINDTLKKCTEHIKKGFQFPEVTSVVIFFDKKRFINVKGKQKNIRNILQVDILKNNEKRGSINVIYHEDLPFLPEETNLLNEISNKFTKAIEKFEQTQNLEKQKKILLSKNRKLTELTEESRQSKKKLQTFFKAISDKIYVIDQDYNIILSNSDEIGNSGKCYNKIFNAEDICKNCPAMETFANAEEASMETCYQGKNLFLQTYPIHNKNGGIVSILEVCWDITKEKKMEFQLIESHKLASLGRVVAGVAHEINNPNTFILGNIKIIQEAFTDIFPILDEKFAQQPHLKIARLNYDVFKENIMVLVDDIYHGSVRLKKIVGDLRTFARKDEDMLSENVEINSAVENSLRLIKNQIKKNIAITTEINPNLPSFTGSISKIEQVLLNIILNASQAIEKEEGKIVIKTGYDENTFQVFVMIKDNGIGMDIKTKSNIFEPFFTTKRNEGGVGLGLSISYRIVKEHKGNLEVNSKLGVGTTFTVHIPVNNSL